MPVIATETMAPRMAGLSAGRAYPYYTRLEYPIFTIATTPEAFHNINGGSITSEDIIITSNNTNNSGNNSSSGSSIIIGGLDVPDNKTNERPLFTKHIYRMNDIFHREDERVKTFDTWPLEWLDKFELARTGMFFTGEADKVKCYFCEVEIGRWEEQDMPVSEHMRWSPNCPLLRRRTTNNVPIDVEALDRALPPASYDICGANDAIEVRPLAYAEGTINMPRSVPLMSVGSSSFNGAGSSGASNNSSSSNNQNTYFPDFPEYAIEAARLRSFGEWPRHMKQKPEQLSEAGFFYTGVGDRVKCFSCGGGLKDWDENDEPWEQHALWMSKCRYLNLMKGQTYIDAVIAKHKAKEAEEAAETTPEAAALVAGESSEPSKPSSEGTPQPQDNNFLAHNTSPAANCGDVAPAPKLAADVCQQRQASADVVAERKSAPNSSIPEEKLCKICYAGEYNTAFLPCGHVVACAKCASSVTKCPLCRKPFTDVMRVYFS